MSFEVGIKENVTGLIDNLDDVTHKIDASNAAYAKHCKGAAQRSPNFIATNVGKVQRQSYANSVRATEEGRKYQTIRQHEDLPVHNYSTSTFNSTRLAKEHLAEQLTEDIRAGRMPKGILTYDPSGEFHHSAASGILLDNAPKPGALNAANTLQRTDEKHKWLTQGGIDHGPTNSGASLLRNEVNPTAKGGVTLLRSDVNPNPPLATVPFAHVLATRKPEFPWETRKQDFDNIVRKSRLPPAVAVNTEARPQEPAEAAHKWNTTRLLHDNVHGLAEMNQPYAERPGSGTGYHATGTGSLVHRTATSAVPYKQELIATANKPRLTLVHNRRSMEKVGRHFSGPSN